MRVELTDTGRALAAEIANGFDQDIAELLGPLSAAARRTLTALITAVSSTPLLPAASTCSRSVEAATPSTDPAMVEVR